MWEMQVKIAGEWVSLRPLVPKNAPPYRYIERETARLTLDRLYPHLSGEFKQVIRV